MYPEQEAAVSSPKGNHQSKKHWKHKQKNWKISTKGESYGILGLRFMFKKVAGRVSKWLLFVLKRTIFSKSCCIIQKYLVGS